MFFLILRDNIDGLILWCQTRKRQNRKNISDSSWHDIFGCRGSTDHKTIFIFKIVIEKWPAQGT